MFCSSSVENIIENGMLHCIVYLTPFCDVIIALDMIMTKEKNKLLFWGKHTSFSMEF